jgi:hypothetical protein
MMLGNTLAGCQAFKVGGKISDYSVIGTLCIFQSARQPHFPCHGDIEPGDEESDLIAEIGERSSTSREQD